MNKIIIINGELTEKNNILKKQHTESIFKPMEGREMSFMVEWNGKMYTFDNGVLVVSS